MRADDRALADLAASVADCAAIDWQSAESKAAASERRLVRHLRLVENIASLYRSIPPEAADEEPAVIGRLGAPAPTPPEPAGPRWGRLVMLERIGSGTSADVFRAWDSELHQEVALKLLHEGGIDRAATGETHRRVLNEARRLARIRHAHVVQVYGAEGHDDRVGLWMELVRGESLEQIVAARGPFGAAEAGLIGQELCAALAAVHAAGLLHRDVKAQNIMRESGGRTVLMDFGTGKELREEAGASRMAGTPLYLAPEIFKGDAASIQSDLYSLGVLLFYLVSGQFPVTAGSIEQLARAHAHQQRRRLRDLRPNLPASFIHAVERALEHEPSTRYRSAGDMEAALAESFAPRHEVVPERPAPSGRGWQLGVGFFSIAAVLMAVVAGLIVWSSQRSGTSARAIRSVAVLPLVAHPTLPSPELTDAMTEQLIATIGQIESIRTTSLTSTLPYKASSHGPNEIAELLGVDAVLAGELRVVGGGTADSGQLLLDAKLIAAGSGGQVWSGSFVRPRGETAALLALTAREVARAVKAPLKEDEVSRLRQVRPTTPAAEEAYLQGRLHLMGYGPASAQRALAAFQRASGLDPNHAAAHAGAALAYVKLAGFNVLSHQAARIAARAEIRKSFEGGEDIAEAHAAEADIRFLYDWDWDGAEREYRRSLDLNPSFLHARNNYAQVLAARRQFDQALKISEETLRIDPQSGDALVNHGMLLYYKRDFSAAEDVGQRAVTQEPDSAAAHFLRSRVAEGQRRYEEALAAANQAWQLAGSAGVNLRVVIIRLQELAGHSREARISAAELEKAGTSGALRVRSRDLAYMYLGLGRTQAALDAFEAAFDERDPTLVWLIVEPRVDPLRNEPRFQAMLHKLGVP